MLKECVMCHVFVYQGFTLNHRQISFVMTSAPVVLFMRNSNGLVKKVVNITETIYKDKK